MMLGLEVSDKEKMIKIYQQEDINLKRINKRTGPKSYNIENKVNRISKDAAANKGQAIKRYEKN